MIVASELEGNPLWVHHGLCLMRRLKYLRLDQHSSSAAALPPLTISRQQ